MNAPQDMQLGITSWLAPLADSTEQLWSEILLSGQEHRRVLFTGIAGGDGVTTMAAIAALGLARNLRRPTLLVETNVHRPGLGEYLGAAGPGFAEFCRGEVPGEQTIWQTDCPLLHVMTAGSPDETAGLFAGPGALELLDELTEVYERIVLDAAPVMTHPDTLLLVRQSDAVALVTRFGHTRDTDICAAVGRLQATGVPILGVVLNQVTGRVPRWLEPTPELRSRGGSAPWRPRAGRIDDDEGAGGADPRMRADVSAGFLDPS